MSYEGNVSTRLNNPRGKSDSHASSPSTATRRPRETSCAERRRQAAGGAPPQHEGGRGGWHGWVARRVGWVRAWVTRLSSVRNVPPKLSPTSTNAGNPPGAAGAAAARASHSDGRCEYVRARRVWRGRGKRKEEGSEGVRGAPVRMPLRRCWVLVGGSAMNFARREVVQFSCGGGRRRLAAAAAGGGG